MAQSEFAKRMGLTRTTVSNMERGVQRIFLDQVYQAAQILNVPPGALLPPLDAMIATHGVHSATDDPIPEHAAAEVARVVALLMTGRTPTGRTRRRLSSSAE